MGVGACVGACVRVFVVDYNNIHNISSFKIHPIHHIKREKNDKVNSTKNKHINYVNTRDFLALDVSLIGRQITTHTLGL